jgi:superfamily II DNA or RNA helicase
LTERVGHLELLAKRLGPFARNVIVLRGGRSRKKSREPLEKLAVIPDDEERLLLATGRYIGEGFDDARLDTLFLTMPISWKGTLQQYVGRLHRQHGGKNEVRVYDYVDQEVPVLRRMYERRLKGYKAMGYEISTTEDSI